MNAGVVGIGMIAQRVVPHLSEWGLPVGAVCATPREEAQIADLADRVGAKGVFTNYGDMLASQDIDTVYIAVPNALHYTFAKQALEAGKDVIVEKPFTSNFIEADELAALAKDKGLLIYEAITNVYLPNIKMTKRLLARIGTIKLATIDYSQLSSRYAAFCEGKVLPAFDPAASGGALMDLGLYTVQIAVMLFGEPDEVRYDANIERGIDTSGILNLDYGAFKAACIIAKDCEAPSGAVIQGTDGCILIEGRPNSCRRVVLRLNDGTEEVYEDNPKLQWECEFRAFAEGIAERDVDSCYRELERTLSVSRVMTRARRTAGIVFPADER